MTETINLDATNAIIGRLCTYAAKQALLGKKINIYNCENAVISGNPNYTFQRYHHLIEDTGQPFRGPNYPKLADRFVRRIVRGMVPHKQERGRTAYARIMCFIGAPADFKDKLKKVELADMKDLGTVRYITIKELIRRLGGRQ